MTQINRFNLEQLHNKYLTKFQRQLLEKQLKVETIPEYRQRIEIMLLADEGKTQTQICRTLNCSPLTARHWIFVAKSGQAHNWQTQPIGRPKTVTSDYLDRLKQLANTSPKDLGYPFSRWTGQWLSKHLSQEFNISVSARHINRLLEEIEVADKLTDFVDCHGHRVIRSHHLTISDLSDRQPVPVEPVYSHSSTGLNLEPEF
jgi:transposase